MDDIEQKALALVKAVLRETESTNEPYPISRDYMSALCRAIEQHEATKQERDDLATALKATAAACAHHVNTILQLRSELADFKQEVSNAVEIALLDAEDTATIRNNFSQFIIPKPDPLVDALKEADSQSPCSDEQFAEAIRAALEARGLEIVEKRK